MGAVLFVFVAEVFEDVGVGQKAWVNLMVKGLVYIWGSSKVDFDIHVSEVAAVVAFHDAQGFAVRVADHIEPGLVVEAGGFHHQGVALPFADGVAEPGRLRNFLGKRAAVGVDLAMRAVGFVQDDDQPG